MVVVVRLGRGLGSRDRAHFSHGVVRMFGGSGRGLAFRCRLDGGRRRGAASLDLLARPILVVRVLLHVQQPQPIGLFDVRLAFLIGQHLPAHSEPLADLSVMHVGLLLAYLAPLDLAPHHERIHGPLDVIGHLLALGRIRVRRR